MRPLAATQVNLDDTFEILMALPDHSGSLDEEELQEWCIQSARNLSAYFTDGDTELAPMWEAIIRRLLDFWWAVRKDNILLLYGGDFVRDKIVYGILGESPRASLLRANEMRRVLVLGETGTGKEVVSKLIARALVEPSVYQTEGGHVRLSAAEFTDTLLQAELFGYKRGAFTGASKDCSGILGAMPDGGVLFFDELGEASNLVQAQLLRVLQTGEYRPVGSPKVHSKRFQFIGATNVGEATLASGTQVRKDLYHRLSQHVVTLPPLRSLVTDSRRAKRVFDTMFAYELRAFSHKVRTTMSLDPSLESARGLDTKTRLLSMVQGNYHAEFVQAGVTRRLERLMHGYPWPGNLRECSNLLRRIIKDGPGSVERHCQAHRMVTGEEPMSVDPKEDWPPRDLKVYLANLERDAYTSAARESSTIGEVANRLGVTRQTASRKLAANRILLGPQ